MLRRKKNVINNNNFSSATAGCSSADDLILEVVVLLGTLAGDECAAVVLLQRGLLDTLVSLINGGWRCVWSVSGGVSTSNVLVVMCSVGSE